MAASSVWGGIWGTGDSAPPTPAPAQGEGKITAAQMANETPPANDASGGDTTPDELPVAAEPVVAELAPDLGGQNSDSDFRPALSGSFGPRTATSAWPDIPLALSESGAFDDPISELQQSVADMQEEMDDLRERQADEAARLARVESGALASPSSSGWRLQLIDLRLRQSGDAAAAARDLSMLRSRHGVSSPWLDAEADRLRNAESRARIAGVLQGLLRDARRAAENPPQIFAGSAPAAFLVSLFNIRRADEGGTPGVLEDLRRLELLFLSGQREAYLEALDDFAARGVFAGENAQLQIDVLKKFGAPRYALDFQGADLQGTDFSLSGGIPGGAGGDSADNVNLIGERP